MPTTYLRGVQMKSTRIKHCNLPGLAGVATCPVPSECLVASLAELQTPVADEHHKLRLCCGHLALIDHILYRHFVRDSIPLNLLPILDRSLVLRSGVFGLDGLSGVVT